MENDDPKSGGGLLTRRSVIAGGVGTAALSLPLAGQSAIAGSSLPVRHMFGNIGTYLNAAATHPIPQRSAEAGQRMLAARVDRALPEPGRAPVRERLAKLINADPTELALVASTGQAEYLVGEALRLGPGRGVVTDAYHFEGAIAMYTQRARGGMPLTIVRPEKGKVDLDRIAGAITNETKLIAISEISNFSGYRHDLTALCGLAHSHGIPVFADIIQSVGAVPVDVQASGVDFCAASTYKWLMGDLGSAFLYVRAGLQQRLADHPVGWNELQNAHIEGQNTIYDGSAPGDRFQFRQGAAGLFEMGMQSIVNQAVFGESLDLIDELSIGAIAAHRRMLLDYASERLSRLPGVRPLSAEGQESSIAAFAIQNAAARYSSVFKRDQIAVGLYEHRLRLSPSVFNSKDDIDRLAQTMLSA